MKTRFDSVLVVCTGNICRSPIGERILAARLNDRGAGIEVASAGVGALVGHAADEVAASVAAGHGISLDLHVAQQFSHDVGRKYSLILVMEKFHRHKIVMRSPDLSGRIMMFDHWSGGKGIADPFRQPRIIHEKVFRQIDAAAIDWVGKLCSTI